MAQLDPTKLRVQSNAVPIWETETTFQDMMAEQLRHAPWLMLSVTIHLVAVLIAWVLFPAEDKKKIVNKVEMAQQEQLQVEEPPTPPPPVIKPEEIKDEVVVTETQVTETQAEAFDNVESDSIAKESAFDSNQLNSALGLGGGAGGRYGGRVGKGGKGSGGKPYIEAIDAGLKWLKHHQDEDGKWDTDQFMKHDTEGEVCDGAGNPVHDVGVTGLALLAFLGDGSTLRGGPYKDVIKKGILWLREQQDPNTGLFGMKSSHDFIYNHAIAAYAMTEAFGLSQYSQLKKNAQLGINYLESHRNPYSVWRYEPRDNDNDLSVTGWCIMAYESGGYFGLDINKAALDNCATFMDSVSEPNGRHGYTKAGEPSSRRNSGGHAEKFPREKGEAMTAVGLFCRYFMNQDPKEKPVMNAAADLILSKPPIWDVKAGTIDEYYWYYATYALFQKGGRHWDEWKKKLDSAVVKSQHRDEAPTKKNLYGSWDPIGCWGEDGGRVYTTAILTLTLEAYFRYTKLVR